MSCAFVFALTNVLISPYHKCSVGVRRSKIGRGGLVVKAAAPFGFRAKDPGSIPDGGGKGRSGICITMICGDDIPTLNIYNVILNQAQLRVVSHKCLRAVLLFGLFVSLLPTK